MAAERIIAPERPELALSSSSSERYVGKHFGTKTKGCVTSTILFDLHMQSWLRQPARHTILSLS
jgi:hypothetical protein